MSDFNPILDKPKAYLDYISTESQAVDFPKRLTHLALFLYRGGNLQTFVNEYRNKRESYITSTIYDTLLMSLVYLRMGEPITGLNNILKKKLNENQLVELLSAELRERSSGTPTPRDIGTFKVDIYGERYDLDKYLEQRAEAWAKIIYGESLLGKLNVFAETRERLAADNPWLIIAKEIECMEYENPTNAVHPKDRQVVEAFNDYAKEEHRLRLNLPPEPFQGNPLAAEVVILTLNPGFVEECNVGKYEVLNETERKNFIKAKCKTMSMQDELCVPDNDIINDIGERYWERKLKSALVMPDANKKIAVMQFLGYFSGKYNSIPKRFFNGEAPLLHTQQYTIRLVRYLMQQGKVIIIARAEKEWYKHIPELEHYKKKVLLNNYLNPTISPANCKGNGWGLIESALSNN